MYIVKLPNSIRYALSSFDNIYTKNHNISLCNYECECEPCHMEYQSFKDTVIEIRQSLNELIQSFHHLFRICDICAKVSAQIVIQTKANMYSIIPEIRGQLLPRNLKLYIANKLKVALENLTLQNHICLYAYTCTTKGTKHISKPHTIFLLNRLLSKDDLSLLYICFCVILFLQHYI